MANGAEFVHNWPGVIIRNTQNFQGLILILVTGSVVSRQLRAHKLDGAILRHEACHPFHHFLIIGSIAGCKEKPKLLVA